MKLSDLKNNETGFVVTPEGSPSFRLRLEELGFVPGQEVTRLYASPMGTPIVFSMLGQRVALRKAEADHIAISTERPIENYADEQRVAKSNVAAPPTAEAVAPEGDNCGGCPGCGPRKKLGPKGDGTLTIALVGNPNCGKTTVFNAASGGHERTGNYAGVPVASVVGETTFEGHLAICRPPRHLQSPRLFARGSLRYERTP